MTPNLPSLQAVRGTRDLLGETVQKFRHIEQLALATAARFGFEEIETPVIESSAVFKRSLGDTSDIVMKEMYAFKDLGGDELVLRPEGTAGVARAFISEGLAQNIPLKLFYRGPMFRYERPQRGRYRQFYQLGVEILGVEKVQADLELLSLAQMFLEQLKLSGQTKLNLNTIGDKESRAHFRERLVAYLTKRETELSQDSRERLLRNPLRILDSKDAGDHKVLIEAPQLKDSLNDVSKKFFFDVLNGLTALGIDYHVDPKLVRGLDYYCHLVFEFQTDALGAQNAICSGGRYDGLIQDLGGPQTAGVGWAAGIDRLAELSNLNVEPLARVALVPMGEAAEHACLALSQGLRKSGVAVEVGFSGNVQKRMKRADKLKCTWAIVIGDNELQSGRVAVKHLATGQVTEAGFDSLLNFFVDGDFN